MIMHEELTACDFWAEKIIVIFDKNQSQSSALCELLTERGYRTIPVSSISDLNSSLHKDNCLVVLIDLDTVPLNNRTIRDLTLKYPQLYFLCLSSKRFHPELKDAICYHIFACINKPLDTDEIFYWLKSIYENERV